MISDITLVNHPEKMVFSPTRDKSLAPVNRFNAFLKTENSKEKIDCKLPIEKESWMLGVG